MGPGWHYGTHYNMVATRTLQNVSNELRRDRGSASILFVLAGVREAR